MSSCQRCKQTTNSPQAFLLTCRGCDKTWHHRCHMPPVEDEELVQRLRATNCGDTDNDITAWRCRRCKKNRSSTQTATSSHELAQSSPERHVLDASLSARVASTTDIRVKQELELSSDVLSLGKTIGTLPPDEKPQTLHGPSAGSAGASLQPCSSRRTADNVSGDDPEDLYGPPVGSAGPPPQPSSLPTTHRLSANPPDDDPDDIYGPPVERRIIRILPSLADELREQQRRTAAEKEKRRTPLAPEWILARHAHDPLWKETRPMAERRRRKPLARKLEDNGLNVSELLGYLTLQDSLRMHKAQMDVQ